jgi:hypothetical protein
MKKIILLEIENEELTDNIFVDISYTVAQPVGGDCKIFDLTKEKSMIWSKQASNTFSFGNGTEFTMPLATWNHLVITIKNSGIHVYANTVLTVTETVLSIHPTGPTINTNTDRAKLN